MKTDKKKIVFINLVIILVCITLSYALFLYSEKTDSKLYGQGIVDYLKSKKAKALKFSFAQENTFVVNTELYIPLPSGNVFLKTPIELQRAVKVYAGKCTLESFLKAESIARENKLSPSKLLIWHKSICENRPESFLSWVERSPLVHPSGKSYALWLSEIAPNIDRKKLEPFFHVSERTTLSEFDHWYLSLSSDQQKDYYDGFRVLMIPPWIALADDWNGRVQNIYVYSLEKVNEELIKDHSFRLVPTGESQTCEARQFRFCLEKALGVQFEWNDLWSLTIFFFLSLYFILFNTIFYLRKKKYRENRNADQALLFQLISHEIRTPLTALKLNIDGLRKSFNKLDEGGQRSFLSLLDNFQSVETVVKKTLKELKKEGQEVDFDIAKKSRSIVESHYEETVEFIDFDQSVMIRMSEFWFETCLTNLIKNALNHGQKPIKVRLEVNDQSVFVEVEDAGSVSLKSLKKAMRPFQKSETSSGLGLGLSIVARKIDEVGGKLLVLAGPTRYRLQFNRTEKK